MPAKPAPEETLRVGGTPEVAPTDVVLKMEGHTMTLQELDVIAAERLEQLEAEHQKKRLETRREVLSEHVDRMLIEAEVARLKLTDTGELIRKEVMEKTPAPSDDEVKAFFEANKKEMPGDLEAMKEDIRGYLHEQAQRDRFGSMMQRLREDAKVEVNMPEFRVDVAAVGPSKGAVDAAVTIVVFSDFECPFCSRTLDALEKIEASYGDKVRVVFRDYPLPFHKNAPRAHEAARCADAQGKFWAMHDLLFQNQSALDEASLPGYAKTVGLDEEAFGKCMASGEMAALVQADALAGSKAGVNGTPAFFINGIPLSGAQPFPAFKEIIDRELARTK